MDGILYLIPVLLPMIAGGCILALRPKKSAELSFLTAVLTALTVWLPRMTDGTVQLYFTGNLSFDLNLDPLAGFFLILITVGFGLAVLYAREYLGREEKRHRFFGFALLTLGSMVGLAMAGNILTFYMFYEMMSLLSFPLVLYSGEEKARKAAMSYLGFSVFGASLALCGIFLAGQLSLFPFRVNAQQTDPDGMMQAAFLLMMLGFSCKAGMMPLANWLPTAHPVAPAPASALLSGIITKAGILGMIRTAYFMFGASNMAGTFAQKVLLTLSIVTVFCGSMLAYKEKLLKKRLAYSSVSQISYVIFGLMLLTHGGLEAGLMQVAFHACAKVGLFLCAGAFIHHCNANYVDELTGMGRRMPVVMACFTCFSLSLVGIPPFGGFVSKWLLAGAALDEGSVFAQAGVVVLMISALLTAGYLLPIVARGYFPGEGREYKKTDAGAAMAVPLVFLAVLAAVLGLFPGRLQELFRLITSYIY